MHFYILEGFEGGEDDIAGQRTRGTVEAAHFLHLHHIHKFDVVAAVVIDTPIELLLRETQLFQGLSQLKID